MPAILEKVVVLNKVPKTVSIAAALAALSALWYAAPAAGAVAAGAAGAAKASAASAAATSSPAAGNAAAPAPLRSGLDTLAVRKLYLEGDFEEAIQNLEAALKSDSPLDHGDSVLIFKYLGVMYAANSETREKGKYYMHQLLSVEPTAKIMDMYASDMIYMIFKNIQDEFESSRLRMDRAQGHLAGNSGQEPVRKDPTKTGLEGSPAPKKSHSTVYWLGATGVTLAVGAAAWFYLADTEGETHTQNHPVTE